MRFMIINFNLLEVNMKTGNILEVSAICRDCKKEFSAKVKFYYDSIPIKKKGSSFATVTCPYCGAEDVFSLPFLFYSREKHILYTVFASGKFNSFERIKLLTDKLLEQHLSNSSFKEQSEIRGAERRYIERELFLKEIGIDERENFILGQRNIRFTPPPNISIKPEYCFLGDYKDYNLSKNDIAFSSSGLSLFQKNIILEACNRLNNNGFTVNLIDVEETQQPSVTCGFLSIVLTVGSVVIIPILVNVISDIINDLRHKKEKPEPELKKNDDIRVTICEDGTKKVYCFEGNPDKVIKAMRECGQSSLKTLSLKDCHTAIAIDNLVADLTFPSTFNHQTFNEIAKEYQKVFHPNSAIEINLSSRGHEESEEIICYKASLLMKEGDYMAAYWMMFPLIDTAQNIEFFYNLSLCLSHLDIDDQTILHAYEHVIKKYLACADLKDLEKFDGNIKQDELNKSMSEMIKHGIFVEDEEGIVSTPDPQTDEEIQNTIDAHNAIWHYISESQKYNIEDLKQEAYLNSIEAQLSEELESVETSLHTLMNSVSEKAINQINKWRDKKERGEITEKEWEQGLLNDELLIDTDCISDDKSISEQFDFLFKKKMSLEKTIERVRGDRRELHAKHLKNLF